MKIKLPSATAAEPDSKGTSAGNANEHPLQSAQLAQFLESPDLPVEMPIADEPKLPDAVTKLRMQYCANSGRPIRKLETAICQSMLAIHGESNAIKLLEINRKSYSPEWLWLNDTGLQQLAIHRPREYFIYSCSKLFSLFNKPDENLEFEEKIIAWANLDKLQIANDVIHPINELIRRLLANWHSIALNRHFAKLSATWLSDLTASQDALIILQIELTDLIPELVKLKKQSEETERGLKVFKAQKMIRGLSQLEIEINMELNDFDFIDGKSSELIHGIIGTSYRHEHKKHDLRVQKQLLTAEPAGGFSRKPIVKTGTAIKLKFGGNK